MAVLHNRISQKELKAKLYEETVSRVTLSFYRYFTIADIAAFRDALYLALSSLNVFGRIYVAAEGINGQISVPQTNYEPFKRLIDSIPGLENLRLNVALDDDGKSFWVLKVKIRPKIVADGIEDPDFDMNRKGRYVDAHEFNNLTDDPETIVIDMRNHYEYEVGHFENAKEIPSDTFREQLPISVQMLEKDRDKNIIMYCTGGIRCEKASAYLLHRGFQNVFHLEGGIINYVNTVKAEGIRNKFRGKNFVFDERLGERVSEEVIAHCHQCGARADVHTNCRNEVCHLLFIQCKDCADKFQGCCSQACQDTYQLPEDERRKLRKGKQNGLMVFNKSRRRRPPLVEEERNEDGYKSLSC